MGFVELLRVIESVWRFPIFTVKDTTVTVSSIFIFLMLMAGIVFLSKVILRHILDNILKRMKVEVGMRYNLLRIAHYIILFIGTIIAFQFIGINLSGLLVIFGFLSVGIGFGLQNIASNFISGLIILFERPIRVGDRVTVGNIEGDVVEINIRSTTVRSLNHISIIVPNSEFISAQVINWSHGDRKVRIDINVGVHYESDLDTVLRVLREIAQEHKSVLRFPEPDILFLNFGDSAWNMRLR
ncbi:MAG: mechanosensitive ion channel domain-containing protein, partial [candidate division KSB1 bacterium]|nr:mechanosensitive ion channel domain-containing protein [candidate division KSB1 bacterium]